MALKGLDIFKLTPKSNCKECGNPTCMAFAMKLAQGSVAADACPHLSDEATAMLGDASAPPMKTLKLGACGSEHTLGGETVLFRHDKTFVSKPLFAVNVTPDRAEDAIPAALTVDYDRIGERMYVELLNLEYQGDKDEYVTLAKDAAATGRAVILQCNDADAARAALAVICAAQETTAAAHAASAVSVSANAASEATVAADSTSKATAASKPLLNGANAINYATMYTLASEFEVALGVSGKTLDEIYDTVAALEALGCKNMVIDVGRVSIKDAFANAVQIRRAALKDGDRNFGYPSLVNLSTLAPGDTDMQTALASLFTLKYGSIIVMDEMTYAQALPLYGLRQNIYTDPQKPMKMEPGIYPINGAGEDSLCCITVDFALTYFVVSGELERSNVPVNLFISDAGGYSVLTAWAAGKLSASSVAKFISEFAIESKIKNRTLIIPGKVAVLKGEIEEKLPDWNIVVAPNEAVGLVKFLREYK